MPKDPREKAEKYVNKGHRYYDAESYKKAGKYFNSAGELYYELHEFEKAEEYFFNSANSFINDDRYDDVIENLRYAGDSAVFLNDFLKAYKYFKVGMKYIPRLKSKRDKDFNYVLFSSLAHLCLFIKGKQDQGIKMIKEIKKHIDSAYFRENPLIILVKNLTIAIRDKNEGYLDEVEKNFEKYKFRDAEEKLMKEVLVVAKTHISLKTSLIFDKEQYTTNELVDLKLEIDTNPLTSISNHPFYEYKIEELKISDVGISLSDNLITQKKPTLPVKLSPGEVYPMEFVIRPNFQVDNTFVGPLLLTCEIDEKFIFFLKTQSVKLNLISPPPSLEVSTKNLKTPLIGKSFPMEILVQNLSEGEAFSIEIEMEMPEQLKLMRGNQKKQIYALRPNEEMSWEVSLQPKEAGDYEITFKMTFNDPDQNQIEQVKVFPLDIKL